MIQADFRGGLNLFDENIAIADSEYCNAFNVRNRTTALESIKLPLEDETAPRGKKQGCYAFDNYLLLFCAGRAYYKNVVTDSAWTQIAELALDPTVDYIYVCAVPASTFNYNRKLASTQQVEGNSTESPINVDVTIINGTPAGAVIQDGINQPWLIKPDASAVLLQTYEQWTSGNREYVPVMRQMCYINGILFGIAQDGKTILRSVSGRPLDFVINVKTNGDKGGDAFSTSHRASYDAVTYLGALSSGELLVATANTCYPLTLNYDKTIFAEPTFLNLRPFSAGIVNQFSFVDIHGDYGFVDFDGIRSFNAVLQQNNEGRNSVFSAKIQRALSPKQTTSAAVVFNDFSFFALDTTFGNVLAVYDNIRQQWVCFDDYDMNEQFKMFTVARQGTNPTLYAITDSKVYKLFAGTEYATATIDPRALISGDPSVQIRLENVFAVFKDSPVEGTVTITEFANGAESKSVAESLEVRLIQNLKFNFKALGVNCFSSQLRISWDNGAKLLMLAQNVTGMTQQEPLQQIIKRYVEGI